MKKLGIILHTNNPKEYFSICHDSVQCLLPMLAEVEVTFLFNFQPPWTKTEIAQVGQDFHRWGMPMRFVFSRPKGPIVSTYKLRHDAAALLPDADWWMYCDDNLEFKLTGTPKYPEGSATRYLQVLDYFNTFPKCGVVMCEGSLGGHTAQYQIRPTKNGLIATQNGLFFRNTTGGLLHPGKEYRILGGMGETAPAYRLMTQGYYIAKQFNNPTRHHNRHYFSDTDKPDNHITNYEKVIKPNAERYIRTLYEDDEWTHEARYIPHRVWEWYEHNGGDMEVFRPHSAYCKDYRP